jgi:imidazole glycerol-phosphate synthase subunit HisF
MYRPRVIPVLLLKNQGLVKSVKFKNHNYIGDPINAVKIFNDLRADELVFLDILASKENRTIPLSFVEKVGDECHMPFSVGGGLRTIEDIKKVIHAGAEKVVINTYAAENPSFIKEAAKEFGSSTIMVSMDVRKNFFGKETLYTLGGTYSTRYTPVEFAKLMEDNGAGEIIINSIDKDGTMQGYDLGLTKRVSQSVTIPVIACGGAGTPAHLTEGIKNAYASAVAAGSMFVYHGPRKAVLISYPTKKELQQFFSI